MKIERGKTIIIGMENQIKQFYKGRAETNWTRRYQSPYIIRRYFFQTLWKLLADQVPEEELVLDSGCGDGVLAVLMASWHKQQKVIAMDISEQAIRTAREAANAYGVTERMLFIVGDSEHLPFKGNSLPAVISSHVLEHLNDFDEGAREIMRVLRRDGIGIIALPMCLNPGSIVHLGGDFYWCLSKRSLIAFWIGLIKVIIAAIKGDEGVQEGYAGHGELPHIRRFPSHAIRRIAKIGFKLITWRADSLLIPYIGYLFPGFMKIQKWFDSLLPEKYFFRHFGNGIIIKVKGDR